MCVCGERLLGLCCRARIFFFLVLVKARPGRHYYSLWLLDRRSGPYIHIDKVGSSPRVVWAVKGGPMHVAGQSGTFVDL